eukprot:Clim_evm56s25 gene=Clim_evmTU56s25
MPGTPLEMACFEKPTWSLSETDEFLVELGSDNGASVVRTVKVFNPNAFDVRVILTSTFRAHGLTIQFDNENLQTDLDAIEEGSQINELFNLVNNTDSFLLTPFETRRLVLCFNPRAIASADDRDRAKSDRMTTATGHPISLESDEVFYHVREIKGQLRVTYELAEDGNGPADNGQKPSSKKMDTAFSIRCTMCRCVLAIDSSNVDLVFDPAFAGKTYVKDIQLYNRSEMVVPFSINLNGLLTAAFTMQLTDYDNGMPLSRGKLAPFGMRRLRFSFCPKRSGQFFGKINIENEVDASNIEHINFRAVVHQQGRNDMISVKEASVLNFGDCYTGVASDQKITLQNNTRLPVDVSFKSLGVKGLDFLLPIEESNPTTRDTLGGEEHAHAMDPRVSNAGAGAGGSEKVYSVTIAPLQEREIIVRFRPVEGDTPENARTIKKRLMRFRVELNSTSTATVGMTERRTLQCRAQVCTSMVELSHSEVHLGDLNIGTIYTHVVDVANLSELPTKVEVLLRSKVVNCPKEVLYLGPLEKVSVRLQICPRRVNPDYRKEVIFANMFNRSNDQVLDLRSNNVDEKGVSLHSLFYNLVTPSARSYLSFGRVVSGFPSIRSFTLRNVTKSTLELRLTTDEDSSMKLFVLQERNAELLEIPSAASVLPPESPLLTAAKRSASHAEYLDLAQDGPTPLSLDTVTQRLDQSATKGLRPPRKDGEKNGEDDSFGSPAKVMPPAPIDEAKKLKDTLRGSFEISNLLKTKDDDTTLHSDKQRAMLEKVEGFSRNFNTLLATNALMPVDRVSIPSQSSCEIVAVYVGNSHAVASQSRSVARHDEERIHIEVTQYDAGLLKSEKLQGITGLASLTTIGSLPVRDLVVKLNICKSAIDIRQKNINFGSMSREDKRNKVLLIYNPTDVPLFYNIMKSGKIFSDDLHIGHHQKGIVAPYSSRKVEFLFKPTLPGRFEDVLLVQNLMNPNSIETVHLKAVIWKPPNFFIDHLLLDFGTLSFPESVFGSDGHPIKATRVLRIANISQKPRTFVVEFSQVAGTPGLPFSITLTQKETEVMTLTKEGEEEIEKLEQKLKIAKRKGQKEKAEKIEATLQKLKEGYQQGPIDNGTAEESVQDVSISMKNEQGEREKTMKQTEHRVVFTLQPRIVQVVEVEIQIVHVRRPSKTTPSRITSLGEYDEIASSIHVYEMRNYDAAKAVKCRFHLHHPFVSSTLSAATLRPSSAKRGHHNKASADVEAPNMSPLQRGSYRSSRSRKRQSDQQQSVAAQELYAISNISLKPVALSLGVIKAFEPVEQVVEFLNAGDMLQKFQYDGIEEREVADLVIATMTPAVVQIDGKSKAKATLRITAKREGPQDVKLTFRRDDGQRIMLPLQFTAESSRWVVIGKTDTATNLDTLDYGAVPLLMPNFESKPLGIVIRNNYSRDLVVRLGTNLSKQAAFFADARCEKQCTMYTIPCECCIKVFLRLSGGRTSGDGQMLFTEGRELVGGLRVELWALENSGDDPVQLVQSRNAIGEQSVKFKATIGVTVLSVRQHFLALGETQSLDTVFNGQITLANGSRHMPVNYIIEGPRELTTSTKAGQIVPGGTERVDLTIESYRNGLWEKDIVVRNAIDSANTEKVTARFFVDTGAVQTVVWEGDSVANVLSFRGIYLAERHPIPFPAAHNDSAVEEAIEPGIKDPITMGHPDSVGGNMYVANPEAATSSDAKIEVVNLTAEKMSYRIWANLSVSLAGYFGAEEEAKTFSILHSGVSDTERYSPCTDTFALEPRSSLRLAVRSVFPNLSESALMVIMGGKIQMDRGAIIIEALEGTGTFYTTGEPDLQYRNVVGITDLNLSYSISLAHMATEYVDLGSIATAQHDVTCTFDFEIANDGELPLVYTLSSGSDDTVSLRADVDQQSTSMAMHSWLGESPDASIAGGEPLTMFKVPPNRLQVVCGQVVIPRDLSIGHHCVFLRLHDLNNPASRLELPIHFERIKFGADFQGLDKEGCIALPEYSYPPLVGLPPCESRFVIKPNADLERHQKCNIRVSLVSELEPFLSFTLHPQDSNDPVSEVLLENGEQLGLRALLRSREDNLIPIDLLASMLEEEDQERGIRIAEIHVEVLSEGNTVSAAHAIPVYALFVRSKSFKTKLHPILKGKSDDGVEMVTHRVTVTNLCSVHGITIRTGLIEENLDRNSREVMPIMGDSAIDKPVLIMQPGQVADVTLKIPVKDMDVLANCGLLLSDEYTGSQDFHSLGHDNVKVITSRPPSPTMDSQGFSLRDTGGTKITPRSGRDSAQRGGGTSLDSTDGASLVASGQNVPPVSETGASRVPLIRLQGVGCKVLTSTGENRKKVLVLQSRERADTPQPWNRALTISNAVNESVRFSLHLMPNAVAESWLTVRKEDTVGSLGSNQSRTIDLSIAASKPGIFTTHLLLSCETESFSGHGPKTREVTVIRFLHETWMEGSGDTMPARLIAWSTLASGSDGAGRVDLEDRKKGFVTSTSTPTTDEYDVMVYGLICGTNDDSHFFTIENPNDSKVEYHLAVFTNVPNMCQLSLNGRDTFQSRSFSSHPRSLQRVSLHLSPTVEDLKSADFTNGELTGAGQVVVPTFTVGRGNPKLVHIEVRLSSRLVSDMIQSLHIRATVWQPEFRVVRKMATLVAEKGAYFMIDVTRRQRWETSATDPITSSLTAIADENDSSAPSSSNFTNPPYRATGEDVTLVLWSGCEFLEFPNGRIVTLPHIHEPVDSTESRSDSPQGVHSIAVHLRENPWDSISGNIMETSLTVPIFVYNRHNLWEYYIVVVTINRPSDSGMEGNVDKGPTVREGMSPPQDKGAVVCNMSNCVVVYVRDLVESYVPQFYLDILPILVRINTVSNGGGADGESALSPRTEQQPPPTANTLNSSIVSGTDASAVSAAVTTKASAAKTDTTGTSIATFVGSDFQTLQDHLVRFITLVDALRLLAMDPMTEAAALDTANLLFATVLTSEPFLTFRRGQQVQQSAPTAAVQKPSPPTVLPQVTALASESAAVLAGSGSGSYGSGQVGHILAQFVNRIDHFLAILPAKHPISRRILSLWQDDEENGNDHNDHQSEALDNVKDGIPVIAGDGANGKVGSVPVNNSSTILDP